MDIFFVPWEPSCLAVSSDETRRVDRAFPRQSF
jgi:hypothetical protein